MKSKTMLLALSLLSLSTVALAAIEHPDCKVAAKGTFVTYDGEHPFDITTHPELVRLFDDTGYTVTADAAFDKLATGALYADLGIICGAQRRYRTIEYVCASSLKLWERTASGAGSSQLGGGHTDGYSAGTMEEAARLSVDAALRYVPRCTKK